MARDQIFPGQTNGDVSADWQIPGQRIRTRGHVFTDREFRALACGAGLKVVKRVVVDYATGEIRRSPFRGHLVYVLRHASDAPSLRT